MEIPLFPSFEFVDGRRGKTLSIRANWQYTITVKILIHGYAHELWLASSCTCSYNFEIRGDTWHFRGYLTELTERSRAHVLQSGFVLLPVSKKSTKSSGLEKAPSHTYRQLKSEIVNAYTHTTHRLYTCM